MIYGMRVDMVNLTICDVELARIEYPLAVNLNIRSSGVISAIS